VKEDIIVEQSQARSHQTSRRRNKAASRLMYEPLDWALVRAPLLPVETYLALSKPESENEASEEAAGPWAFEDGSLVPRDPHVRRAIAVGSSDLLDGLERSTPTGKDAAELKGKLLRYLIRMSTRPTPYGLFAGVALAGWGPVTDLALAPEPPHTRTRPDMEWLLRLVLELEARPEVRSELRFFANPGVFLHAGRIFLSEPAPTGESGAASPVSLRATGAARRALDAARKPVLYRDLVAELLSATPGATPEKVEGLITRLWRQTVLLTDLRPPLTTGSPARYVAERLTGIPAAKDAAAQLEGFLEAMETWDALPPEEGAGAYRSLMKQVESVGAFASETPLQTDMALALDGRHVTRAVGEEVARAGELLLRLSPWPRGLPHLQAYRQAFLSRYGQEREVPLLELLDPNFGLGPPSGHGHGAAGGVDPEKSALRQRALRDLAIDALRGHQLVVELDGDLLASLDTGILTPDTAPTSLDVSAFVSAHSVSSMDAGDFQIVIGPNLGASAAARNLGRFADLLSPGAEAALDRADRAEAAHAPDRLRAELVYLPQRYRSANVAIRPAVRSHEIVLGTTSGVPADRVIPLDELVVGTRDGRFYVRWLAENVQVDACAGHMLNNMQAPAAIRFLDDVGRDGSAQLSPFDWGAAADFPFLPRVQMGRIVLSLAQWRLDVPTRTSELPTGSSDAFTEALTHWRLRWRVPRHVYLSFGDNRLLLDLEEAAQVEELRAEVHRLQEGDYVVVQEALPAPDEAWATGPGGHFVTEFMVPLVLRDTPDRSNRESSDLPVPIRTVAEESRLRPPGSDWLFAKLYCPRTFEEDLIAGSMRTFCEFARAAGLAEEWFFVRYSDPDPHLRLRFRGVPERLLSQLVPQFCSWAADLTNDGVCLRFCFDTYDRELERYGGVSGTAAAEALFAADSRAVAELLYLDQQRSLGMDRTTLTVLSIDDLLAGLGLSDADRLEWYRDRVVSRHESGLEYRQRKGPLRSLLGDPHKLSTELGGEEVAYTFAARRAALESVVQRLGESAERGELGQPRNVLYRSFVHLHCNRLLGSGWTSEEQALGLLLRTREGLDRAPLQRLGAGP
jgi:thiopeptide-type bacteriocin biosynthesis protein